MRGRQQVYPTFECAPNRALSTRKILRDMPIFRGSERACRAYVRRRRGTRGMSRGAGSARVDMPISCGSEWACQAYVRRRRGTWCMSRGAGPEGSIGRCREVQVF